MDYIGNFYQQMIPRLTNVANEAVYEGVLKSSPSEVMNALGQEYTLINLRIREMVMLKSLAEMYYSDRFPQTNILTLMDSVEAHAMFETNSIIAKNLKYRLTQLAPGAKAPNFVLSKEGEPARTLLKYQNKYLYLHFFDPSSIENRKEIPLLKDIYLRYSPYIEFVTIYKSGDSLTADGEAILKKLPWKSYAVSKESPIWKNYRVESYPYYTLIDGTGNIVSSPSLGPTPNGEYKTIDQTFFYIKKKWETENRTEGGGY